MNLLDRLRSYDLAVRPFPGWETRTNSERDRVATYGILNHYDAIRGEPDPLYYTTGNRFGGTIYHMVVRRDGSVDLLSQRYVWHAGSGDARVLSDMQQNIPPRNGTDENTNGNPYFFSISINHHPDYEVIPDAQFKALVKANAAVADHFGLGKNQIADHATWTDRKRDIKSIPWPEFRELVAIIRKEHKQMQLPAERRTDVEELLNKGHITGQLSYYFPVAGQPSADLDPAVWTNVAIAALGGVSRAVSSVGGPSASQIRKIIADAINNG